MQRFMQATVFIILVFFVTLEANLPLAQSTLIPLGIQYQVEVTNSPGGDFGGAHVTLDGNPSVIAGGTMTVTEVITPDADGGEWLEFVFETTDGGPLSGNPDSEWMIHIFDLDLGQTLLRDSLFLYFSFNGEGLSDIEAFVDGLVPVPNPINPALGDVYLCPPCFPFTISSIDISVTASPSDHEFGFDPTTANDFHLAFHLSEVPEPSTSLLLVSGGIWLAFTAWRRPRRRPMHC